jgi:hypothetical protein
MSTARWTLRARSYRIADLPAILMSLLEDIEAIKARR